MCEKDKPVTSSKGVSSRAALQPFTFDLRDQSLCRISRVASADHRRVAFRRLTRLANDLVSHEFWATARLSWHVSVRGHITSDAACPIGVLHAFFSFSFTPPPIPL